MNNPNRLDEDLFYWQEKLGLQAWNINLKLDCVFEQDDLEGLTTLSPLSKAARIGIASKAFLELENKVLVDEEHILVHELLHVLFANIEEELEENCEEKVYATFHMELDQLARTLVAVRRNCNPKDLYKMI